MIPHPRQRRHERWTNSGIALMGGAGLCLLACVGVELPLEGDAENGGTGDTAGAAETAGTVSGNQGGSAGNAGSSAGRGNAGKGGSAGPGTGGAGAVAAGTGGDRSDGGAGSSAASSGGEQASGGSTAGALAEGGTGALNTCGAESFRDSETMTCRPYTVCAPGERVGITSTAYRDRTCVPCEEDTFSENENAEACWGCRLCGSLGIAAACTPSSNTKCGQTGRVIQFGTGKTDLAAAVAVDAAGNVWVTGYTFQDSNENGGRTFVQKIPTDGSLPFYDEFGSTIDLRPGGIAVDHQGNVWVTGFFDGMFEGADTYRYDAYVRKYPSDGSAPVTDTFGSSPEADDRGVAVTVDSAGNVWIGGLTNGDLAGPNLGSYDLFARIYPSDGSAPVTHHFGSAGPDWLGGITADDTGKIWITAATDTEDVESPVRNGSVTVWQLQPDGSMPFTDNFGDQDDFPWGIAADHAGNIWVTGTTRLGPAVPNLDITEIFVRKYPADGSAPVTDRLGILDDTAYAVTVDTGGNVWVAGGSRCNLAGTRLDETDSPGTYFDPVLFEDYSLDELCAPAERGMGERDLYVRKYPADGGPARGYQFGSMWDDYLRAAAPGVNGDIWLFGDAEGALGDFDPANGPGHGLFLWQMTP